MRNGPQYAAKIKKMFTRFRRSTRAATEVEPDDPTKCLARAILGVKTGEQAAEKALNRIFSEVIDWNEVRVSHPKELAQIIGNAIPDAQERVQALVAALQSVYEKKNCPTLDFLKNMGLREAKHFLEKLKGVDEYAVASVMLWSLGGHAIPVDDRQLQTLQSADWVCPESSRSEVQSFLERHIGAANAKEFCRALTALGSSNKRSPKSRKTK